MLPAAVRPAAGEELRPLQLNRTVEEYLKEGYGRPVAGESREEALKASFRRTVGLLMREVQQCLALPSAAVEYIIRKLQAQHAADFKDALLEQMLPEIEAVQEALRAGGADCRQALSSLAAKLCKMAQEHTQLMEEAKAPLGALAACVHIIRVHVNKRLLVHKVAQAAAVREQLEEHKDLAYLIWAYDRDPTGAGLVKKLAAYDYNMPEEGEVGEPDLLDKDLVKMTQRWSRESLVAEDVPATCDLSAMAEGLGSILIEIRTKSSTLWRCFAGREYAYSIKFFDLYTSFSNAVDCLDAEIKLLRACCQKPHPAALEALIKLVVTRQLLDPSAAGERSSLLVDSCLELLRLLGQDVEALKDGPVLGPVFDALGKGVVQDPSAAPAACNQPVDSSASARSLENVPMVTNDLFSPSRAAAGGAADQPPC